MAIPHVPPLIRESAVSYSPPRHDWRGAILLLILATGALFTGLYAYENAAFQAEDNR